MIGLKKPTEGSIKILGMDVLKVGKQIFDHIGVQLQETAYQDKIKVYELCELFTD
jgi:ABC-2 type transport system ATP-binding protein